MIVLDTNVVSASLKTTPEDMVVRRPDNQSAETLDITAVTRAEIRFGVLSLPDGKRKNALAAQVERVLELFLGRTLEFDSAAADKLAHIAAECEKNGKRAMAPDAYIAACAAARGFSVATRNVTRFQHLGVRVMNPGA